MTIEHKTIEQFYRSISELVKLGLTFNADVETLTIKLTGGF